MNQLIYHKNIYNTFHRKLLFLIAIVVCTFICSSLTAHTRHVTSILDESSSNNSQNTLPPLVKAIKKGNLKEVKQIVERSHADVNETYANGCTPLMAAVFKGDLPIVEYLISQGAELESCDDQQNTALMYAFYDANYGSDAKSNDSESKAKIVEFLLHKNADTDIINKQGYTPLILAALNNHVTSIQILVKHDRSQMEKSGTDKRNALMHAINNQSTNAAKTLIDLKTNTETRDKFGFTPFLLAAFNNDPGLMKKLMDANCNVYARTTEDIPVRMQNSFDYTSYFNKPSKIIKKGSTALDIAQQFECLQAEHFLKKNVNKN